MRRSGILITSLIIVILLVTAEVFIIRSASNYEPRYKVLFAKERIARGDEIVPAMLEFRDVGLSFMHSQSVKIMAGAVSKFAGTDIEKGEMILSTKLEKDNISQSEIKDKTKRLFSVEFKGDQANGWWLKKDQYVDILFIPDEKAPAQQAEPVTQAGPVNQAEPVTQAGPVNQAESVTQAGPAAQTGPVPQSGQAPQSKSLFPGKTAFDGKVRVISDIRIAALIDENGQLLEGGRVAAVPRYVSFEVTEEQADFLAFAKSNGRLELSVTPGK